MNVTALRQKVASFGVSAKELDTQIASHDERLLDLVDSRDRFFTNGRKVSELMIKGGLAIGIGAVVLDKAIGLGSDLALHAVYAGIGLATLSIPVNMSRSVMLEMRRHQLEKTAAAKLELVGKRQQLARAEAELAEYERIYGETERLVSALKTPGGNVGRMGNSVYFNGIRARRRS